MKKLLLIFVLFCNSAFGQIKVIQFNAEWNNANAASWTQDLKDCKTISYVDISKSANLASKHKIAVIPTIIIFNQLMSDF